MIKSLVLPTLMHFSLFYIRFYQEISFTWRRKKIISLQIQTYWYHFLSEKYQSWKSASTNVLTIVLLVVIYLISEFYIRFILFTVARPDKILHSNSFNR